jgi:hypothetical protein
MIRSTMRTHLPLTVAGTAKSKKNTLRSCSREALAGIGVVNVATLPDRGSNNVLLEHNVKDRRRAVVVRPDFPQFFCAARMGASPAFMARS